MPSFKEEFELYNKKQKVYGNYSYDVGRIIGIDKKHSKLYVQFGDTSEDCCHVFKAGIPTDYFDIIDKLIQVYGKNKY